MLAEEGETHYKVWLGKSVPNHINISIMIHFVDLAHIKLSAVYP